MKPDSVSLSAFVERELIYRASGDEPRIDTSVVTVNGQYPNSAARITIVGCGTAIQENDGRNVAVAELVERHAIYTPQIHSMTLANFEELGSVAVDPLSFAQCSAHEYKSSKCPVVKPSRLSVIRWVKAISLNNAKVRLVPAQAVFLTMPEPAEHLFVLPISTGAAAHISLVQALNGGLLEVIERDALSLMWLLRTSPPQFVPGGLQSNPNAILSAFLRSGEGLAYTFLNISTDVSVPVVAAIRRSSSSQKMRNIVACAASMRITECTAKVVKDLNAHAVGFRGTNVVPDQIEDFSTLQHGSTYMAHADRSEAFQHLSRSDVVDFVDDAHHETMTERDKLRHLVTQMERLGLEAFAVDLSTRESLALGLYVVKVIVPGLQPLPFHYRCRYLGSGRLQQVSPHLVGKPYKETAVNKWPIPFS